MLGSLGYRSEMITPAQIRAARALIGWKQSDLATAADVSISVIKDIEREVRDPRASTLLAIEAAFGRAGVMFLDVRDVRSGGYGVRLASERTKH